MDPASNAVEKTLALFDRLEALYRELTPLETQYRAWAREFQATGVPHDKGEFIALVQRIKDVREHIEFNRTALAALAAAGGAR